MAHAVPLVRREEYAGDLLWVAFGRPEGYAFQAGQWCFLQLPDLGFRDERGLRRHLSITSSPQEEVLGFATKVSASAFKQTLAQLEPGQTIEVEEAKGTLSLPTDRDLPVCFLAGGIGVTPFRSLIVHSIQAGTGHRITLLSSSRTPEESLFLQEFQDLSSRRGEFRFVATMTRMHQSTQAWNGRQGRMDAEMIREEFPDWERGVFYVAGPPKMVETMHQLLAELEIPERRVTTETFMGY